ncbi:MAG: hypothetical protein M1831_006260 [Alyxoria varia]|nr:MAG: hypothetical protein M1831_006260 [Alyxoria varia]
MDSYLPRRSVSADQPLPSPTDTPYQTPRASGSHLSSFATPESPVTPPPLPPISADLKRQTNGDHGNGYDPQHFTPMMHASLVSEILTLRRDIDSKNDFIEDLESKLSNAKAENESIHDNLRRSGKESRALKRELQLHENGTLSAMEALAKERDEVTGANAELKRKLDMSQKRTKSQDDENRRFRALLEQERSNWNTEKQGLDRKSSLAESRLKSILEELAARESKAAESRAAPSQTDASIVETIPEETQDDSSSVRSLDTEIASHAHNKGSLGSVTEMKPSLAEELDFDEDEDAQYDQDELDSIDEDMNAEREKRMSRTEDGKARKVLGIVSAFEGLAERDSKRDSAGSPEPQRTSLTMKRKVSKRPRTSQDSEATSDDGTATNNVSVKTSEDKGSEHSEDKSTVAKEPDTTQAEAFPPAVEPPPSQGYDIEANQRRKRHPIQHAPLNHVRAKSDPSSEKKDHSATQTRGKTPSPITQVSNITEVLEKASKPEMISAATQTDPLNDAQKPSEEQTDEPVPAIPPPPPVRPPPPVPPADIPSIEIHPPESRPTSPEKPPREVMTRTVGCQTDREPSKASTRSIAVQTEAIRVDKRLLKLPPHLLPSFLGENKSKSETRLADGTFGTAAKEKISTTTASHSGDQDKSLSAPLPPLEELDDANTGDDEAEDPSWLRTKRPGSRRSRVMSPELPDLDLREELDELNLSDGEVVSTAAASKHSHRAQKQNRFFAPPEPVPEHEKFTVASPTLHISKQSGSSRGSFERSKRIGKRGPSLDSNRPNHGRHGPLSRNGSVRSRSPSFGSVASSSNFSKSSGPAPPFAIPARRSSKEQNHHGSRVSGPPSPSFRASSGRTSPKSRVARLGKQPTLRKARSAAAVTDVGRPGVTSKHRPPPLTFDQVLEKNSSNLLTPTNVTAPRGHKRGMPSTFSQLQGITSIIPTGNASMGGSAQHSVVDAITATMIGEWMWKYMRKRKSFGVSDQPGDPSKTSDTRHKRWMWLSPYERTIMWSTKQPTSNAALMGKAGRKLPIQSVLDVKDDTAPPKAAQGQVFDRSVLVLTPDRALKFTAPSSDRHHMWLTALSFLAHQSPNKPTNLSFLPPAPSVQESESSGRRSRASSFLKNAKKTNASVTQSQQSSGQATPTAQHQPEVPSLRQQPNQQVPDTAFAPTVPRVPHRRKRSNTGPSRGRSALGGGGSSALQSSNNSLLSTAGTSTNRAKSQSRASSARSVHGVDVPALPALDDDAAGGISPTAVRTPDLGDHRLTMMLEVDESCRDSTVSAEFGSNNNFFDMVGGGAGPGTGAGTGGTSGKGGNGNGLGVVRMDAFMKPGVAGTPRTPTAPGAAAGGKAAPSAIPYVSQTRPNGPGAPMSSVTSLGHLSSVPSAPAVAAAAASGPASEPWKAGNAPHHQQESSGESFIGPPDIGRHRSAGYAHIHGPNGSSNSNAAAGSNTSGSAPGASGGYSFAGSSASGEKEKSVLRRMEKGTGFREKSGKASKDAGPKERKGVFGGRKKAGTVGDGGPFAGF